MKARSPQLLRDVLVLELGTNVKLLLSVKRVATLVLEQQLDVFFGPVIYHEVVRLGFLWILSNLRIRES